MPSAGAASGGVLLTPPSKLWSCPCGAERREPVNASIPMHNCPLFVGLSVPLVPEGSGAEVRLVEREDYIGDEVGLRYAEGRPIMATETRRPDGSSDLIVHPGIAVMDGQAHY